MLPQTELHISKNVWITSGQSGIENKILNQDCTSGSSTLLVRYAPGTSTSEVSRHTYYEEVYILEGFLYDRTLKHTFAKGCYCYRHPGMLHGPYDSPEGCTMLVKIDP